MCPREHLRELKKRSMPVSGVLKVKMLSNRRFGPSSERLLNIYKIMIRKKLDYGAPIYPLASSILLKTLEPVQNTCLYLFLRMFPTSLIASLEALCSLSLPNTQIRNSTNTLSLSSTEILPLTALPRKIAPLLTQPTLE